MAIRWVCPECGTGVNAPSRMNAMDTRRFCLACSAGSPRLVERSAPKLERQRSAAKAKQADVARQKRERASAAENLRRSVRLNTGVMIRVDHLAREAWALPVRRNEAPRARLPEIQVRQGTKGHSTGRCWYGERIVFTFGRAPDLAEVIGLVIHEVAHELAYQAKGDPGAAHGRAFWSYCRALVTEWTGVQAPPVGGDKFSTHDAMTEHIRTHLP